MRRFSPQLVWRASERCGDGIPDRWVFICSRRKENLRSAIWRQANSGRKRVYIGSSRPGVDSDGLAQIPAAFFSSTLADESHYLSDRWVAPILFGWPYLI